MSGRVVSAGNGEAATAGQRSAAALSVEHLSKRFGDRIAFDDVSFAVGHGEVFGFLGPNGAGKTTTVRTLGTLIAPTSGAATIAGLPLTPENGVAIRRRIAIMPEVPGLYLPLSVRENLACFADLYEVPDATARIDRALRAVHLTERASDVCGALSKGLRQRVALARALLGNPEVLFLDEPTSGLDPVAARDVHELIDGLRQRGVTIFLTTHRLEEAERQQGTLEPVLTTPIRREEFLLGKALAALVPSVAVAYAVYAFFLVCVWLFAHPGVASALIQGPDMLAQLVFTPLLAVWSIWIGLGMSARSSDVRVA